MSRRRGQTGYVWQKNQSGTKNWDATIPAAKAAYSKVNVGDIWLPGLDSN
jgi:hypothetical protein